MNRVLLPPPPPLPVRGDNPFYMAWVVLVKQEVNTINTCVSVVFLEYIEGQEMEAQQQDFYLQYCGENTLFSPIWFMTGITFHRKTTPTSKNVSLFEKQIKYISPTHRPFHLLV